MRAFGLAGLAAAALFALAESASADPGGPFHRTTPRASLDDDSGTLILGIPGGRAWGIESPLTPLEGSSRVVLTVAVDDPDVSEAFVRVAFYARADVRTRQLATRDSPYVRVGQDRRIAIDLAPPPGAVAFRLRVLGRLAHTALVSRDDAIQVRWPAAPAERGGQRPSVTRLETDLP